MCITIAIVNLTQYKHMGIIYIFIGKIMVAQVKDNNVFPIPTLNDEYSLCT
jgi:hypothetical protein